MHIRLRDLTSGMHVTIQGDEPWLEPLYQDFPPPSGNTTRPRLTGDVRLMVEDGGSVRVRGAMQYAPLVTCSRCSTVQTLPLGIDVDARFVPEQHDDIPKEKTLTAAEVETYFLERGGVDLEQLTNDLVQTSVPSRILCASCQAEVDASDGHVYTTDRGDSSPFAALKNLKLPD